ncbi:hypothetical protein CFC21_010362 [Triticum aestivum]|uniref:Pentacotripeptide-repeat region of PRORP domain-containing protein n=2 Tax=Triticum aestivum TaxID=4565 RepID=A0A3B5ZP65_WHEAT|nr:hypothetical protein CFC21_010362 [Triticum aestivum]
MSSIHLRHCSTMPMSHVCLRRRLSSSSSSFSNCTSPPSPPWSPHAAFAAATERVRARTLSPEDAHHLFDVLFQQATPVPERSLDGFLAALSRATPSEACGDGPALALTLFNRVCREEAGMQVVPPTIFTYGILMNCCCRERRPDLGLAFFGRILKAGLKTNLITANTVLKCLYCAKHTDEAVDMLLHRMSDLGCVPDDFSYNTVLHGFFKEGKIGKACNLFHEMMLQGFVPDVVTYNLIIEALCKARAMDNAELFLRQMVDNVVPPDKVTYTSMIHGYSTLGRWKEATKMFREMTSRGLIPNIVTWSSFMDSLCKHGKSKEAAEIFFSMAGKGHKPNIVS